jgi:hypothetical protein
VDQPSATLNVWSARIPLLGIFPINLRTQRTVVLPVNESSSFFPSSLPAKWELTFRNQKALQQEQVKGGWAMQKDLVPNVSPRSSEVIGAATSDETATEAERVLRKLIELRWQREVIGSGGHTFIANYSGGRGNNFASYCLAFIASCRRSRSQGEIESKNRELERPWMQRAILSFKRNRPDHRRLLLAGRGLTTVDCSRDLGSLTEAESG